MFSIKATYHNETRKFTFNEPTFPSYNEICSQLYRVFPISNSYYLSKLLFCPTEGSRVLVGMEVHTEAQYNSYIAPFVGRAWPGGLLRFSIFDDTPHKAPTSALPFIQSQFERPLGFLPFSETGESSKLPTPPSFAATTMPTTVRHCPEAEVELMDIDRTGSTATAARSIMSSQHSCCSVSEGKNEMKELMSNFLRDFTRSMSSTFGEVPVSPRSISTPRASIFEVNPSTPKAEQRVNMEASAPLSIPGSFVERTPEASESQDAQDQTKEKLLHPNVWCDCCGRSIRGLRSKCVECADYDLCEDCIVIKDAINLHKACYLQGEDHVFRAIEAPTSPSTPPALASSNMTAPHMQSSNAPNSSAADNAVPVIHTGIICDICTDTILGIRYKCLDCPDYDLCSNCMPRAQCDHYGGHEFFAIEEPGHVIVHTVFSGGPHGAMPSTPATTEPLVIHLATCNLCDSIIRGDRYKCVNCPDFDTCTSCYNITSEQHPYHVFVKVSSPQNLSKKGHAHLQRHQARCDACNTNIFGVRYKCMHPDCPDFDLCENCEALPISVHPPNHPMLKMRNPDTMVPRVIRTFNSGLSASASTSLPHRTTSEVSVTAAEALVETAEASVQLVQPETAEAAVSATVSAADVATGITRLIGPSTAPMHRHETLAPGLRLLSDLGVVVATPDLAGSSAKTASPFMQPQELFYSGPTTPVSEQPELIQSRSITPFLEMPEVAERANAGPILIPTPAPLFSRFPVAPKSRAGSFDLHALFISDNYVQDGQVFPAGAEFIKSWRMQNDGDIAWPETTTVAFVAGDRLPAYVGAPTSYPVGRVEPGQVVTIYAHDMKTPEVPGKYVGYWRLNDGSRPFGQSVWCDIVVPENEQGPPSNDSSLSSSAIIMPEAAPVPSSKASVTGEALQAPASIFSTPTVVSDISTSDDGDSSVSLIDHSDSASDDSAMWEETRSQPLPSPHDAADIEYVVLYDDDSSSADEA